MPSVTEVACPQCRTNVIWNPQNKYRPFCSERCRLIDLGAWANEEYKIAAPQEPNSVELDDPEN